MPFIWERSGTQYVAMVTKILSWYCGAPFVESYSKKSNISDTNWLRYFFHQNLVEYMSSLGYFTYFKNLSDEYFSVFQIKDGSRVKNPRATAT